MQLKRIFSDFLFRQYRKSKVSIHELKYLFWECTLRCNLNCIHCGSDCKKDAQVKDMPVKTFINEIDKIKHYINPNKTIIVITGGEPLLRNDLEKCGLELYKRGFPWGIVSNGFILTEKRLKSLVDSGLRSITISLDGLNESHNWFRGNNESFQRAYNAIDTVSKHPELKFDIVTCVNRRNLNELNEIKELLINLNVKKWRIVTIFPKGRARRNDDLKLTNEQFKKYLNLSKIPEKKNVL